MGRRGGEGSQEEGREVGRRGGVIHTSACSEEESICTECPDIEGQSLCQLYSLIGEGEGLQRAHTLPGERRTAQCQQEGGRERERRDMQIREVSSQGYKMLEYWKDEGVHMYVQKSHDFHLHTDTVQTEVHNTKWSSLF